MFIKKLGHFRLILTERRYDNMSILVKIKRNFVYSLTKKPTHYVHVDDPNSLQDLRQIQYNNWCKRKAVYNGSYLPKNPETLLRKGWNEFVNPHCRKNKHDHFKRKSTGQIVRYDFYKIDERSGEPEDEHYQWYHDSTKTYHRAPLNDRYGRECEAKKPESHLAPLDEDYNFR